MPASATENRAGGHPHGESHGPPPPSGCHVQTEHAVPRSARTSPRQTDLRHSTSALSPLILDAGIAIPRHPKLQIKRPAPSSERRSGVITTSLSSRASAPRSRRDPARASAADSLALLPTVTCSPLVAADPHLPPGQRHFGRMVLRGIAGASPPEPPGRSLLPERPTTVAS